MNDLPTPAAVPNAGLTMLELIDRIQRADDAAVYECLAADVHSLVLSLSRLTPRKYVEARDMKVLFERFRLTLSIQANEASPENYRTRDQGLNAARGALGINGR